MAKAKQPLHSDPEIAKAMAGKSKDRFDEDVQYALQNGKELPSGTLLTTQRAVIDSGTGELATGSDGNGDGPAGN